MPDALPRTLMGFPVVIDDRCKDGDGAPSWGLSLGDLSEYVKPPDVYLCDEHFDALGDCWEYTICTAPISWHDCSVSGCGEKAAHLCSLSDVTNAARCSGIKVTLREAECEHSDAQHIADNSPKSAGSVFWCPNCGAISINGKWRKPNA